MHHVYQSHEQEVGSQFVFFFDGVPRRDENIQMNGNIFVSCGILLMMVNSVTEAELGALFLNIRAGKVL
jgi:hypothetical protein